MDKLDCVISARAVINSLGEGLSSTIHALSTETNSLSPRILEKNSFPVPYAGLIEFSKMDSQICDYPDFDYKKKVNILFSKIFLQLSESLQGVSETDAVLLTVGTSEYRASWSDQGFDITQKYAMSLVMDELKKYNIVLKDTSNIFFIDNTCASSSVATGMAAEKIRQNVWKSAFIISVDLITLPILLGLKMLGALTENTDRTSETVSRPFSKTRDGFVRSEVACGLFLENSILAHGRNISPVVSIAGYAQTSDSAHITAGCPDSRGIESAMRNCLSDAKIEPTDIQLIKAHGTGTKLNDQHEAEGIRRIFSSDTPVISLKGQFGHAASASGAFEMILCEYFIQSGKVPKSWNSEDIDDLNLTVLQEATQFSDLRHILVNAFGFGGHNCSVLLRKHIKL